MSKGSLNYAIGIALLLSLVSILFYKSIFREQPFDAAPAIISEIQDLQVQLHRDLLLYRNNQIQQYDTLNRTLLALDYNISLLTTNPAAEKKIGSEAMTKLEKLIADESLLIEDFKTHHSILQNSLFYIFRASTDLYSTKPKTQSKEKLRLTAELISLLLEYNANPENNIASRIYPLIDILNLKTDADTNALIIHSLTIIERLPEIDQILSRFNSLNVEKQVIQIKDRVTQLRDEQNDFVKTFNVLLFLCTVYLIFYIIYIFINLQKSRKAISDSNTRLNEEISLRCKTEKALYNLVNIDKNTDKNNDQDRIVSLLNAICTALDVEYAYISKVGKYGSSAKMIGLLEHGMFSCNFKYPLANSACEEVIKNRRLVYNRDFIRYSPDCSETFLASIESYIGINLVDKNEEVIGILAIASDSPITDTSLAENILSIATSRAIIELEHQIDINKQKRYQQGLALIDDWIARLITEGYDRDVFFNNICRAALELTGSQLAAFPVLNNDHETYQFISACGSQCERIEKLTLDINDGGLCAWTMLNNRNLLINDVASDPRAQKQLTDLLSVKAVLLTPVTLKDRPYGAIAVFNNDDDFDEIDEKLMTQLSQSIKMAIINMQLVSEMRSERERAEVTLHSIGDAVITTNIHGHIEYMNHVAESLTAWTLEEAKNKAVQDVFRIEDLDTGEAIHDVVMSCLDDGISINKSALNLVSKNGHSKNIESSISPILKTSGKAEGMVIVFHDETQRRQLEKAIKHQSAHDPLTDLLNHETFIMELAEYIHDARNNSNSHILFSLSVDSLKLINDTAGYGAGNQCLLQAAESIQACIRDDDVLARMDNDAFGLILKNCSLDNAIKIADKINRSLCSTGLNWEGCDYSITSSTGITVLDANTRAASDALRKADLACYTARNTRQETFYVYEEQNSDLMRRQETFYWSARITDAIEKDRLRLYAQAIVPLSKRYQRGDYYEILVRLLDEDDQLVSPDSFMPSAERYGLMPLLDRKIIYQAFSFIDEYSEHDSNNTHFFINLSCSTLQDSDIVPYIRQMAEKFNIAGSKICFEVTETAAIKNLQQTKTLIKELKQDGFKFALDDYGSVLSSFQYLKYLPVDFLKIDGRLVVDMVNNTIDYAMVAAINEVAHIMGIETIAEYVENDQIIKKLQLINVDYGQGYGIEQPQPVERLLCLETQEKSPSLKIIHHKP